MAVVPWTPFVLLGTSAGHLHAAQCGATSASTSLTQVNSLNSLNCVRTLCAPQLPRTTHTDTQHRDSANRPTHTGLTCPRAGNALPMHTSRLAYKHRQGMGVLL